MRQNWRHYVVAIACACALGCGGSSDNNNGDGGNNPGADAQPGSVDAAPGSDGWDPADFDTVYNVGPGQDYADPNEVPWESLGPSTMVRIHYRAQPYASKWVINTEATAADPLVVIGVPDAGQLPVISGDGATTRLELNYWNEPRSIIKVGGSNLPDDMRVPSYVFIEQLEIRGAHPSHSFTDEAGNGDTYADNAAAIHLEVGDHITVRGCTLTDSGNGLFAGSGTSNVVISGNYVHGNGISGSIYEHNSYTESLGITFQYNHYGALRSGADGNNLKDRSAGTVVRYNWIEAGNRQLDLVDSGTPEFIADPSYRTTFVYGNVLVEPDGAGNSQILNYGGDSGDESRYRKGTLYFYANTVVSTRSGNTTLVRLASSGEAMDARNNVIVATAGDNRLAITSGEGDATLTDNWLQQAWRPSHSTLNGSVTDNGNLTGSDPGFADLGGGDYSLGAGSACVGGAGALAGAAYPVEREYVTHQGNKKRADDGDTDIGAFER